MRLIHYGPRPAYDFCCPVFAILEGGVAGEIIPRWDGSGSLKAERGKE
jgi:hypothetical protein